PTKRDHAVDVVVLRRVVHHYGAADAVAAEHDALRRDAGRRAAAAAATLFDRVRSVVELRDDRVGHCHVALVAQPEAPTGTAVRTLAVTCAIAGHDDVTRLRELARKRSSDADASLATVEDLARLDRTVHQQDNTISRFQ